MFYLLIILSITQSIFIFIKLGISFIFDIKNFIKFYNAKIWSKWYLKYGNSLIIYFDECL